jgi:rhodanese-related sulfurtransferase
MEGSKVTHPRNVTPTEAEALLRSDPAIAYVDVRSSTEYTNGHVPGSINVPLAELSPGRGFTPNPDFLTVMTKLFKPEQHLIVGCASGGRSFQAQAILTAEGFKNVANMAGGFSGGRGPTGQVPGWVTSHLPVATDGTTYSEARKRAGL